MRDSGTCLQATALLCCSAQQRARPPVAAQQTATAACSSQRPPACEVRLAALDRDKLSASPHHPAAQRGPLARRLPALRRLPVLVCTPWLHHILFCCPPLLLIQRLGDNTAGRLRIQCRWSSRCSLCRGRRIRPGSSPGGASCLGRLVRRCGRCRGGWSLCIWHKTQASRQVLLCWLQPALADAVGRPVGEHKGHVAGQAQQRAVLHPHLLGRAAAGARGRVQGGQGRASICTTQGRNDRTPRLQLQPQCHNGLLLQQPTGLCFSGCAAQAPCLSASATHPAKPCSFLAACAPLRGGFGAHSTCVVASGPLGTSAGCTTPPRSCGSTQAAVGKPNGFKCGATSEGWRKHGGQKLDMLSYAPAHCHTVLQDDR